ncbi:Tyrosine-protein phosphatase Lar-like [Toxocara canis]|uniref:Tyrosine-protein phosphatase Lar-like n=1 Tax=Toxocara canis TaxID=6265 RepID=A0A0B2UXQ0_TOXCA|nr:Tyrosine-protein phosphatase Lar-like [Toxocara canis]
MEFQKTHTLITDLEPNTEYSFRVNAFNRHGDGEFSASKKILTGGLRECQFVVCFASLRISASLARLIVIKDVRAPSEPITQSVTLLNDEAPLRARVEWKPPKATYNLPINKYVIWYKPQEHIAHRRVEVPGTQHYVELDDLTPSEPITQSVTLLNDEAPLRARVEWKPPKATYNLPVNKYVIWYKPQEHIAHRRVEVPGTQHYVELDDLMMGRLYEISVAAENDDGLSANATESLTTPVGIPEAEPLNVRYEISDGQRRIRGGAGTTVSSNCKSEERVYQ